jgi:arginyl-tRNA synthetase
MRVRAPPGVSRIETKMPFETLTKTAQGHDPSPAWLLRPPYQPHDQGDIALISRRRNWRNDETSLSALSRLEEHPDVEGIVVQRGGAMVRLTDECLSRLADRLEAGDPSPECDTLEGRRFRVYFCDPNATKPLHVGHLRNIALGNAIAAALTHAGADVRRRSTVADFGRSMAEAMAGVAESGLPSANGDKGDHYVGRCYSDYVSATAAAGGEDDANPADVPLGRELRMEADAANVLLRDLLRERPDAMQLWDVVRTAVIDGHAETLRSLGVSFDEIAFESDFLTAADELARQGVADGLFAYTDDGAIVYDTSWEAAPRIVLVRADGVPTQHIRCVVLWIATALELGDATTLEICGDEWDGHVACTEPLLERLAAIRGQPAHPSRHLLHGMVTLGGQKIASSEGTSLTVDDIVEWIGDEAPERLAGDTCCGSDAPCDIAIHPGTIALGYFLAARPRALVEFGRAKLFDCKSSPGWLFTLARHHATHPVADDTDPLSDPDYRFTVVRAGAMALYHRQAVESYDVSDLARSATHYARWFVERPRGAHVTAAAGRLMTDAEAMLGLSPAAALAGSRP